MKEHDRLAVAEREWRRWHTGDFPVLTTTHSLELADAAAAVLALPTRLSADDAAWIERIRANLDEEWSPAHRFIAIIDRLAVRVPADAPDAPVLTAEQRETIADVRAARGAADGSYRCDLLLAILDAHFPTPRPEIAHKPCWECGRKGRIRSNKFPRPAGAPFCVDCECGVSGPFCDTEKMAWSAWDGSRTEPLDGRRMIHE